VTLVSAISFAIPRIGVAATVGLVVATQIGLAAWLDHYGLLGLDVRLFDTWRFIGMVLLMVGAWLVLR